MTIGKLIPDIALLIRATARCIDHFRFRARITAWGSKPMAAAKPWQDIAYDEVLGEMSL